MRVQNRKVGQGVLGAGLGHGAWFLLAAMLALPARASALDSAFVRSLVVPGLGQVERGHYGRAALFAGTWVLSGFGIVVSQIHYNEAVDKFREQERLYASYADSLAGGGVVSIERIRTTYAAMQEAHEAADDRLVWRNVFIGALAATYAINIVDMLLGGEDRGEVEPPVAVEASPGGLRIVRSFRF